jgi:hypothetical protein
MDMAKFDAILRHMSLEELREANRLICGRLQVEHTIRQRQQMVRFQFRDVVEFVNEREGRRIQAVVDKFNTKTMNVTETANSGHPGKRWRVAPSMCRKVEISPGFRPSVAAPAMAF